MQPYNKYVIRQRLMIGSNSTDLLECAVRSFGPLTRETDLRAQMRSWRVLPQQYLSHTPQLALLAIITLYSLLHN